MGVERRFDSLIGKGAILSDEIGPHPALLAVLFSGLGLNPRRGTPKGPRDRTVGRADAAPARAAATGHSVP